MADKKLGFKDFLTVDYAPGMDPIIKRNAKKRKSGDTETSAVGEAKTKPVAPQDDPIAQGKHAKNIGMGWTGKHKVLKDKPYGKHVHVFQYEETNQLEEVLDEALNPTQRRARGRLMKRFKAKIQLGAKRAKMRTASMDKIKSRAMKQARTLIFKKLTKGVAKSELPFQRRQEIEKRLASPAMKRRIEMIAKKLIPKARRDDMERKQAKSDDDKK